MKALRYISIIAVVSTVFFSCTEKETDIPTPEITFSDKVDSDFEGIILSCIVRGNVTADKLTIEYSKDQSLAGAESKTLEKNGESFMIEISSLEIQTTYYYRYAVHNKASIFIDKEIRSFRTKDYAAPIVNTSDAVNVSGTKATINGAIGYTCGKAILAQGFKFGRQIDKMEEILTPSGTLMLELSDLEFDTNYYYQAYAKSEIGTGFGEIKEFKTHKAVSFKVVEVNSITASSAIITGGIADNGGVDIEVQGFRYSESDSFEFSFVESTGEHMLTNLKVATPYKVWYYAKTFEGEFESEQIEFTTSDGSVSFGDLTISSVLATSISLSTVIENDGGSALIRRGFVFSTESLPTIEGESIIVSGTTGLLSGTLNGLSVNTKYYVRAFAINNVGVSYGTQRTVTTKDGIIVFASLVISDVWPEFATINVAICDDGGSPVFERGFCYSLTGLPTISNKKLVVTSSEYEYGGLLGSLSQSTEYYVRAYAKNSIGVYYSDQEEFTTPSGVASFGTLVSSSIENTYATFSCDVLSDGKGTISNRGFCYSTNPLPTTNSTIKTIEGSVGLMQTAIENLNPGTTYYVRAFAATEFGTTYSNEVQITTKVGLPTMSSVAISNVQPNTATFSSGLDDLGDAIILEKGFCYGLYPEPDKNSFIAYVSDNWTLAIEGLTPNTKYYVRSFATTKYGTAYSEESFFTTTYDPIVFGDISIIDRSIASIIVSGAIVDYGDDNTIDVGYCFNTESNPTIDDYILSTGSSLSKATFFDLAKATTYYIRPYIKKSYGVFYGEMISAITYNAPSDVVPGLFSVNSNKRVAFSHGSLVHEQTGFRFATNQYDYLRYDNDYILQNNISKTFPIDMFYTHNSKSNNCYNHVEVEDIHLGSEWSMLTATEWRYLLGERDNASSLISYQIYLGDYDPVSGNIEGVLLFPDNWLIASPDGAIANNTRLTLDEYYALEKKGVVFIPYAGMLYRSTIDNYTVYVFKHASYGSRVIINAQTENDEMCAYVDLGTSSYEVRSNTIATSELSGIVRLVSKIDN